MEAPSHGGRFYKSRKSRPCDCCRKRKVACDMPSGPPCHRCYVKTLDCTFQHGPGERKRRKVRTTPSPLEQSERGDMEGRLYLDDLGEFPTSLSALDGDGLLLQDLVLPDVGPDLYEHEVHEPDPEESLDDDEPEFGSSQSSSVVPSAPAARQRQSGQPVHTPPTASAESNAFDSLELVPDAFSFFIGPTGALDIHLLAREDFDHRNVTRPKIPGLKYRRLEQPTTQDGGGLDPHPVLFGITDQSLLKKAEPSVDAEDIQEAWSDFWKVINLDQAWRLIKLYSRFVDPYFPILATQQLPSSADGLRNMRLSLLAAICASALPFIVYDEGLYSLLLHPPDSSQLYRICWLDISQHLHCPTLATLQACLLLQQRLPDNAYLSDTAFSWSLMATSIAIAQTIGLYRDPMGWMSVPLWERNLRKRIWWAVWMMERWISLIRGMPSHISNDDYDVSDLDPHDMSDCLSSSVHTPSHLPQLVKLSHILASIQKMYYTVRTIGQTSKDLQLSLELARAPRAELKSWLDGLGPSDQFNPRGLEDGSIQQVLRAQGAGEDLALDGSASIHLAYIVTHMTLFRALLRPLERSQQDTASSAHHSSPETMYEGAKAVIQGSLVCVREFVHFLENLREAQWNAFWHSWSRPNFAIAGSFMVHLLHITSGSNGLPMPLEEEVAELKLLIKRWRVANRISVNGAAGARGLAKLGLLRVETMLGKLVTSDTS